MGPLTVVGEALSFTPTAAPCEKRYTTPPWGGGGGWGIKCVEKEVRPRGRALTSSGGKMTAGGKNSTEKNQMISFSSLRKGLDKRPPRDRYRTNTSVFANRPDLEGL